MGGIDEEWPICVGYTGKKQGVEPFMRYVTNNLHLQKPLLFPIGPVISTTPVPAPAALRFRSSGTVNKKERPRLSVFYLPIS